MLDLLRGFSKGWVAKFLIGLLVVSFGVWGISGSLFFGNQSTVVEVGETRVDAREFRFAYENQLNTFSQSLGRRLTMEEANAIGMRQAVLSQVVAGAVLDENARKMGLGISEENLALEIANDPTFRDLSGQFSRNQLRLALRNVGMSEDQYVENRKRVSLRSQIVQGTAESLDMPEVYLAALNTYQNEKRVFEYVTLGPETAGEISEPTDEQISTLYESTKQNYKAPLYRKIAILKLEPVDMARPDDVSEDELKSAYESRKASLRTPERRQIEQLVIDAKDVTKVEKQLADGVSFEEIVTGLGKNLEDINLGTLTKQGLPDNAVAEAAFSATLNKPTEVIDGVFGPVIVRVTKIEPEKTTSFEEISDQLRQTIAAERAVEDVFSMYDEIEDERGAGEAVLVVGEKLKLKTQVIEAVDVSGLDADGKQVTGIPQLKDLLTEAFQAEPGDDTRAVEIGENGFIWFDVLEITPERQKELDEVRKDVVDAWKSSEIDKKVEAEADAILKRVGSGEDFNAVLAEVLPVDSLGQSITFQSTQPLSRVAQVESFPTPVLRAGFDLPKNGMDKVSIGDNSFILFRVADVVAGEAVSLDDQTKEQINDAASQDILGQVVEHLQSRESVTVNRNVIDIALSAGRGR